MRFLDDGGRGIEFGDAARGRATLVALVDFRCHLVCGPILAATAAAIRASQLMAGRDFNFVVVGIDPAAMPRDAARMKAAQLGRDSQLARATMFLSGDQDAIDRLSAAIGYRDRYDADRHRFAHPVDLVVLSPALRVSAVLSGLSIDPLALRAAVVTAREGRFGALIDRLHVLCYGLDPAKGIYDALARALLIGGAGSTLALLGALVLRAQRRRSRMVREAQG